MRIMNQYKFLPLNSAASRAFLLVLLATTTIIYWPALQGPFLLDDFVNIPQTNIPNLNWRSLIWATLGNESGTFGRPVSILSFVLNHAIGGTEPYGFKVVNLLIHLINTVLVFFLGRLIFRSLLRNETYDKNPALPTLIALAASAIWALHPLQVSTVMYVVQRMTLLMTTFSLLALLAFTYSRVTYINSGRLPIWSILLL